MQTVSSLLGPTASMRRVPSSHEPWTPLPYQLRAVDFLAHHYAGGLPLKPGGRKTSISLAAYLTLKSEGKLRRPMLVVAPLRVCRQTWRQEAAKWTPFKDLTFTLLHGAKKDKLLRDIDKSPTDIYLINYEGLVWLSKKYFGRGVPFDIVVFDELTKMKNSQAERVKHFRPRLKGVKYRWGLTGSLFAKGQLGLFGQQLILDDGAALGQYMTHYRDQYFQVGYDGFSYDLLPGAEPRILEKLAPYWFYMDPKDYAQLPPLVDVPRIAEMDESQQKLYKQMKDAAMIALPEGIVTGANAGAVYSKLSQLANGAIYLDDHRVAKVHDLKIEMIDELVDELDGEPLLVAYEFNHDLDRLREWYRKKFEKKKFEKELPWLGKGTTSKNESLWYQQWNRGELPVLAVHPASASHGLNMQGCSAYNVAWFSITWDWEQYDQLIRRIRRDGTQATQIFNHLLIVKGTMDEIKLAAVRDKDFTDSRLLTALNELLRGAQQPDANNGETTMVQRLSRPGDAPANTAPNTAAPAGNGWGAAQPPNGEAEQRQRIQEQISPQPDRSVEAASAFSGNAQGQVSQIANTDYGPSGGAQPAPGGWGAVQHPQEQQPQQPAALPGGSPSGWGPPQGSVNQTTQVPQQEQQTAPQPPPFEPQPAGGEPDKPVAKMTKPELVEYVTKLAAVGGSYDDDEAALQRTLILARATVIQGVMISSPDETLEGVLEIAREFEDYLTRG